MNRAGRFILVVVAALLSLAMHVDLASAQQTLTPAQQRARQRAEQRALQQAIRNSRVFYVSTRGNDANSGITPSSPHRTIQKAMDTVRQTPSVIYVAPGTYDETVTLKSTTRTGTWARPMRLVGDVGGVQTGSQPGSVIISGGRTRQYGIDFTGSSNWRFENLEFRGQTVANTWTTATRISGMSFYNCTFEVTPQWGVYFANSGNLALVGNTFLRTPVSGHATYVYQTLGTVLTITENRLSMMGSDYLSTGFRRGLADTSGSSGYAGGSYGIAAFVQNNTSRITATIRNNVVSDAMLGIYFEANQQRTTLICSNNTVVGCYYGMHIQTQVRGPATITNNITGDSYIAARINAPRGVLANHLAYGIERSPCRPESWTSCTAITVRQLANITLDLAPEFEAPERGEFALVGDVGIDAATTVGAPSIDLVGTQRPIDGDGDEVAVADLGAFESQLQATRRFRVTRWTEIGTDEE